MRQLLILFFSLSSLWVFSQTDEAIEITWDDLGYTSVNEIYIDSLDAYYNVPVFKRSVKELNGKQIRITGYFQCISKETGYYWLSKDKVAGSGCVVGEHPYMNMDISNCIGVENLHFKDKIEISVQGEFILNLADVYKLNFILNNAELVQEEPIEITWDDLADVAYEEVYSDTLGLWYSSPIFGDNIIELENRRVQISGEYTLIDSTRSILSRYIFDAKGLEAHQHNSENELIELDSFFPYFFVKPLKGIVIQGVLRLNATDPDKMTYILENPEIVAVN